MFSSSSHLLIDDSPKSFSLYPVYFDAARSTAKGRKIPLNLAVANPNVLALQRALSLLGIQEGVIVESSRRHPKDPTRWGRIRIPVTATGGQSSDECYLRKGDLMQKVAKVYREAEAMLQAEGVNAPKSPPITANSSISSSNLSGKKPQKAVVIGPGGTILVPRGKKNKKK